MEIDQHLKSLAIFYCEDWMSLWWAFIAAILPVLPFSNKKSFRCYYSKLYIMCFSLGYSLEILSVADLML